MVLNFLLLRFKQNWRKLCSMNTFVALRDCRAVGVPCSVNIERITMEKAWEDMKNMLEDIKENGDNEFERNFCYFLLTYMKVVEKQKG